MPEHAIRLRKAWTAMTGDGATRIDLPADGSTLPIPSTLRRRFRRPPIDPEAEAVVLRLEAVPGLGAVRLNGQELAQGQGREAFEVELGPALAADNELTLEVVSESILRSKETAWGAVALVIRSR